MAERSLVCQFIECDEGRMVLQKVSDHQAAIGRRGQFTQNLGLSRVHRQGLFHEDVLAGAQYRARQFVVLGGGRGDHHGRDGRVRKDCLPLERGHAVRLCLYACLGGVGVADRSQRIQLSENSDQVLAPIPAADHGNRAGAGRLEGGAVRRFINSGSQVSHRDQFSGTGRSVPMRSENPPPVAAFEAATGPSTLEFQEELQRSA